MGKRRIFTVGFSLPGEEFEHVNFASDQTLLDADIILFEPTLGDCHFEYGEQYNGKSILTEHSSFSTKTRLAHWRAEIVAAVSAGKLVIVYLRKPIEYYRYTGEKRHSGTGRSQTTHRIVTEISSYNAVPNIRDAVAKSGAEIRLEKDAAYIAAYWSEFSHMSSYLVEIQGEFSRILLKSRVGDRIVGAAAHVKSGTLLLLPPLQYDYDKFIREKDTKEGLKTYWTSDAIAFGKRLLSSLVGLSDTLKRSAQVTAPPTWALASKYLLATESKLRVKIEGCTSELARLQANRVTLEERLENAGALRRLLFEQGKPLEGAIIEAMKLFGFEAQPLSNGESEFDVVLTSPEGRCLGEAEGRDNKPVNIDKFSQLERNLQEDFARDGVEEHAKGVLFGNAYRLLPVSDRGDFFTAKCQSAAMRIGAALVRTPDLFEPARYLKENPSDRSYAELCRRAIMQANGTVVAFAPPPEENPSTVCNASEDSTTVNMATTSVKLASTRRRQAS